jgi:hypothetical protein
LFSIGFHRGFHIENTLYSYISFWGSKVEVDASFTISFQTSQKLFDPPLVLFTCEILLFKKIEKLQSF